MNETRGGKYGRFLAGWVIYTIGTMPDSDAYRERFLAELGKYSFKTRKQGEPINLGCVRELDDLANLNVESPEELARTVKEGIHLMYQKSTAARVMKSLMENLQL